MIESERCNYPWIADQDKIRSSIGVTFILTRHQKFCSVSTTSDIVENNTARRVSQRDREFRETSGAWEYKNSDKTIQIKESFLATSKGFQIILTTASVFIQLSIEKTGQERRRVNRLLDLPHVCLPRYSKSETTSLMVLNSPYGRELAEHTREMINGSRQGSNLSLECWFIGCARVQVARYKGLSPPKCGRKFCVVKIDTLISDRQSMRHICVWYLGVFTGMFIFSYRY